MTQAACWRSVQIDPNIILPFYWERFKAKTSHLTAAERGGYLSLLLHQWQHGAVPASNTARMAQIMGCTPQSAKQVWKELLCFFAESCPCGCGLLRNRRMEEVRQEQIANIARAKANGGKGGRPPKPKPNGNLNPNQNTNPTRNLDESLPSSEYRVPEVPDESKNDSSGSEHAEIFAMHQRLFLAKYGHKPAYSGGQDGKTVKELLKRHGYSKLASMLETFFDSRDPWIAKCGHGFGPLANSTVQNKLIAEMSGRAPVGDGLDGLREFVNG